MSGGSASASAQENLLVYQVAKKDDDAQLLHDELTGETVLETTLNLGGALQEIVPPPPTLMEQAAGEQMVDVRVRVVRVMFLVNSLFLLACLLFGLPLYMWHTTTLHTAIIVILAVAAGGVFPLAYSLSIWFVSNKQYHHYALAALATWWIASIFIIGTSANLAGDAAPFQFVLMLWAQCVALLVYTRLAPRTLSTTHAMLFMALATMCIWGVSIVVFFYDHDWISAAIVLVLALACIPYHGYQIRAAESRYSMRQEDLVCAVVQFYGDPVLWVVELAR